MPTTPHTPRPFWQTVVLTMLASAATGVGTYFASTNHSAEPVQVAQQAVRVDMVWDMCKVMYGTLNQRIDRLEGAPPAEEPSELALPPMQPNPTAPDPVVLTPPDELFGPPATDEGSMGAPAPSTRPRQLPSKIPTPSKGDDRVRDAQHSL